MTYNRTPEYTLGEKMKKQFASRGAALSGMKATSTHELLNRARMGRNPDVNCAEEAFFDSYGRKANGTGNTASRRSTSGTRNNVKTSDASAKQTKRSDASENKKSKKHEGDSRRRTPKFEPITPDTEIRIRKERISTSFIVFLLIGAMMFMSIIFSVSEIYRSTTEITKLENQLSDMRSEAQLLEIKLEEKNDVELIEQIASEKLGMVGGESVQRKYISLSAGEHIEVYEEAEDENTDGVLLSSIFTSLGKLFGVEN